MKFQTRTIITLSVCGLGLVTVNPSAGQSIETDQTVVSAEETPGVGTDTGGFLRGSRAVGFSALDPGVARGGGDGV